MHVVGLIVEYNPFHNGHKYHIEEARKVTGADVIVAVMSGNFVQRGEPAIIDKWKRTDVALDNGVDLVIELPFIYAVQSADIFAKRAVELLNLIGVNTIVFGSESGVMSDFKKWNDAFCSVDFSDLVKLEMKKGYSYPKATSKALSEICGINEEEISLPNNILGRFYYKAITDLGCKIKLETIKRLGANYHDENLEENKYNISSATAIRKAMKENLNYSNFVPWKLEREQELISLDMFYNEIRAIILSMDKNSLSGVNLVEEGIESKFLKEINNYDNLSSFISNVVSKRYTKARIQRTLLQVLVGVKKSNNREILNQSINYIRILGVNSIGRLLLKKFKKDGNKCKVIHSLDETNCIVSEIEERSTKIYASKIKNHYKKQELIQREYRHPIIR